MSLQALKERINKDYYELVKLISRHIREYTEYIKLKQHEAYGQTIAKQCEALASIAHNYVTDRINIYLPYLEELTDKEATGHDCATCSGRCDAQHSLKLLEFTASLNEIKQTFRQLKSAVLQEYKDHGRALKILIDEVTLLDDVINELFHVEETHLLPRIKSAQNNIHARS
ncbi:MAG: hypothetical protein JSS96_03265 [Bacteroidetes bacterium]|nr:hypothetical protein [Bacteroidota bacterium]